MTNFVVHGPFEVPVFSASRGRIIGAAEGRLFFERHSSLADECGCYVFALRYGNGIKPYYVGKATKSFRQECFTSHKLAHYHECLVSQRGTPIMFLVVANNHRVPNQRDIGEAEDFLIQTAVAVNPDLRNVRGTRQAEWGINGVIRGNSRTTKSAKLFKKMLNLS